MNIVKITTPNKYSGPYTVKVNDEEIKWISDIDLNGLTESDGGRSITLTLLVKEFSLEVEE